MPLGHEARGDQCVPHAAALDDTRLAAVAGERHRSRSARGDQPKAATLEGRKVDLQSSIDSDRAELAKAEASRQSFVEWQAGLSSLVAAAGKSIEVRQRLNLHLRDLIDHIQVFSHGHANTWDEEAKNGDDFTEWVEAIVDEYLPHLRKDKQFRAFVRDVAERRMTKEGQFYSIASNSRRVVASTSLRTVA